MKARVDRRAGYGNNRRVLASSPPTFDRIDNSMKAAAKAGLEQFLTYRMHVLNKLSDRGISERYQTKLEITLPEARVIAVVGSFGPFSVMDLAKHANLDKSQASRAAEALIKRGLIGRAPSSEDGRAVVISLTPEGRALYRKVMPIARKWNASLFACLDDAEREVFGRALDKVIAHALAED